MKKLVSNPLRGFTSNHPLTLSGIAGIEFSFKPLAGIHL